MFRAKLCLRAKSILQNLVVRPAFNKQKEQKMRDFFINSFEILVGVIVVLLSIGVVIAAVAVAFGAGGSEMQGGPLAGLAILIGGAIYVIFLGGLMYMGLGIYQNTKRTAAAVEKLAAR
jgi:hypothetical protein